MANSIIAETPQKSNNTIHTYRREDMTVTCFTTDNAERPFGLFILNHQEFVSDEARQAFIDWYFELTAKTRHQEVK